MGKRERKIEIIKKYLKNVAKGYGVYTYGNIPKTILQSACSTYAGAIQDQDVLGIVDTSILQNGKKGLLFTEKKVYYNNGLLGSSGSVTYKQLSNSGQIPGDIFSTEYNRQALIELLSKLSHIEGENFQTKMDDINNSITEMTEGIQVITETVEKGFEFLDSIFNIFSGSDKTNGNTK